MKLFLPKCVLGNNEGGGLGGGGSQQGKNYTWLWPLKGFCQEYQANSLIFILTIGRRSLPSLEP